MAYVYITYANGDYEEPVHVPIDRDPVDYMEDLAFAEAREAVATEECEVNLTILPNGDGVDLHYQADGNWCHYRLDAALYDLWRQANFNMRDVKHIFKRIK